MSPSPIRCRGTWKIHKRSSEPDRWLDEMGFFRKHTARDASCLFRAVSENIYNTQRYFHKVRMDCVQFMATHRHLFEGSLNCPFQNYLKEMSNPSEWGGLIEISAMSHLYRRDFVIFEANKGPQTTICNGYKDTIYLFHLSDTKHFDVVHTKEFINASSFCQLLSTANNALVYEVLYDGVYQLKDLPYAVEKMLHDNVPSHHVEYFMSENVERRKKQKERSKIFIETLNEKDKDSNNNALALKCKHHMEDVEKASLFKESLSILVFNRSLIHLENVCMNCLNVNSAKDLLDNGITPFPYKVAKALDPDIYRNIEFDAWIELRRELRYGTARYYDGTTLQVGVKCRCKLYPEQPVPYNCHIQEMHPDGGPCVVFIEELGEKRVLNFDQLEPLPVEQIKPWAPPYRYSRANSQVLNISQMLQQIGKITRKQGMSKARKAKIEETKPSEDAQCETSVQTKMGNCPDMSCYFQAYTYPHLDYTNFQPMPVEIQALPLMVDCRPAGASPHEIVQASNGAPPENNQNQAGGSGDTVPQPGAVPASVRASTPATNVVTTYSANYNGVMNPVPPPVPMGVGGVGYGCAPYPCGVKSVVWCGPHAPPPPPPGVNPHVYKSVQPNGADLPMNDIATLRFYFNLGVDCMWAAYGAPPQVPLPLPHPHPHPHPPRHYSPRDIAQDMQQVSLHERGAGGPHDGGHKHKPQDKPPLNQSKGQGQRPLVGPRFKRGNNQDGNQNNHNQNKGHNNNTPNRGPNHRRNSHTDIRTPHPFVPGANMGAVNVGAVPGDECAIEAPLVTYPYIPYPPPIYPVQYYPIEPDPNMMGMMGGMGYVSYEEGVEYAPVQHFYPPPYPPPHLPEHK
ncbi:putative bifunctional UDP-N-acetylglucosamine transferase and deubiquitinase ALG13 isoform X2 [Maniola jurtina]|uniref:putative bifunctional UDP-N-acetylglucosamine transferase and deubiquitinase ALG13 isoform X2 n=1 Tax=Maniola jurtina TaxID=191418 RepID=UPI001E687CFD|nr:putative bifunctional UDP-N-acetylglucosamine transferase and deubiquitinase ALG13 isoform X2 [Maniola jurtina]